MRQTAVGKRGVLVYVSVITATQSRYGGITPEDIQFYVTYENGVSGVFERIETNP